MELSGLWTPMVVPLDANSEIDQAKVPAVVESVIRQGAAGIVVNGTTGENYALTFDERAKMIDLVKSAVDGAVPVIAGVGGMSTAEAMGQAQMAKRMGVDGLMIAAPAYCLPTPDELAFHVKAVVGAAGLPSVLYDYPGRTGVSFTVETLDQLVDDDLILGIKEASGDLSRIPLLQNRYGDKFVPVCGADADSPVFFDAGVKCWIGGIANALGYGHVGIMNPQTRTAAHTALLPLLTYVESGRYFAKVKALMALLGLPVGGLRAPIAEAEPAVIVELEKGLAAAGEWAPRIV